MAHQTHAIPWNTLASHFKYGMSYHSHPQRIDIHPQKKPNQARDLAYFCKAFAKQIHDFGETERAKYEPVEYYQKRASTWVTSEDENLKIDENATELESWKDKKLSSKEVETRKVVPAKFLRSYSPYIHYDRSAQDVESWTLPTSDARYGSWIEGGEMIKILMMEAAAAPPALSAESKDPECEGLKREAMETLLLMANHPKMKILGLRHMHWGHHFGVSRVAEEAVAAYIYLNLIIAMREGGSNVCDLVDTGEEKRRNYMECASYRRLLCRVAGSYDGDAQTLVHRVFLLGDAGEPFGHGGVPNRDILEDIDGVRDYLKGIWRIMVTYDVVVREVGGDPAWEEECEMVLSGIH